MKSISRSSNRVNKYVHNLTTQSRCFDSLNLQKFPDYITLSQYSSLSFCSNPITSLSSLPSLPELTSLKLDHTKITSFDGAKEQPQLTSLSMLSTPITSCKYFFEMCLIAFGTQISRINDKIVTSKQRKFARETKYTLRKYITSGWLITKGPQPINLLHYQTRKRICIYAVDQKQEQNFNQSNEADDNYSLFSKSNTNDQVSKSFSCASSFVSISSDNRSRSTTESTETATTSCEDSPYQLDKEQRDELLAKMKKLTREWNPPRPAPKEKDTFFDNNLLLLFQPSMARNRRLVTRDQRPGNVFRLPVSFRSSTPFEQENKPYLLRKREERELRIKQKQEQLLREQQEYEYAEEEEEEEEAAEEERIELEEEIKNENEEQLKSDLQEETIKEANENNNINEDTNTNDNKEEEMKNEDNIDDNIIDTIEQNEKVQTNENEETKPEINSQSPTSEKKIAFPQFIDNNPPKDLPRRSLSSTTVTTPKKVRHSLTRMNSEQAVKKAEDENATSPLLSESEMEVFRKRRMMSMNKFMLNPNSPILQGNNKNETTNANATPVDEKVQKPRRKTLTHSKSVRHYNKDDIYQNKESSSNPNLGTDTNPIPNSTSNPDMNENASPKPKKVKLLTRRPTYSEILSPDYKKKRKTDLLALQSKQSSDSNNEGSGSQKPERKFDVTKRKTSFVGIEEINKLRQKASKTDTDTDEYNTDIRFESKVHTKPVTTATETTEIQTQPETAETATEATETTETATEATETTETATEATETATETSEIKTQPETATETTETQTQPENEINEPEKETIETETEKTDTDTKTSTETETNTETGNEQLAENGIENDGPMDINELGEEEANEAALDDENPPEKEAKTAADLAATSTKDDEDEINRIINSNNNNNNDSEKKDEEDADDMKLLDEMLKDVDVDGAEDIDDIETKLRLEGFQECIEKHPDKKNDDDFINDYVEQYVKDHMKK